MPAAPATSTRERIERLCDLFLCNLMEHVGPDGAQIMITWSEEGGCNSAFIGAGNWLARQGMAHEFIQREHARTHHHVAFTEFNGRAPGFDEEDGPPEHVHDCE